MFCGGLLQGLVDRVEVLTCSIEDYIMRETDSPINKVAPYFFWSNTDPVYYLKF